jgi:hypothetical protein
MSRITSRDAGDPDIAAPDQPQPATTTTPLPR